MQICQRGWRRKDNWRLIFLLIIIVVLIAGCMHTYKGMDTRENARYHMLKSSERAGTTAALIEKNYEEAEREATLAIEEANKAVIICKREQVCSIEFQNMLEKTIGDLYCIRAHMRELNGKINLAIQDLEQSLSYNSYNNDVWKGLITLHIKTGDLVAAQLELNILKNLDPQFTKNLNIEINKKYGNILRKASKTVDSSKSNIEKRITNTIGMSFVKLRPGMFMMGSLTNELGRNADERLHRVELTKGFYLGTTEVTQGQWRKIMGENPSSFKSCGDNCPVENVSWDDAKEFIRKLNKKERTKKYRLPTEAEWEYACRAAKNMAFANGVISKTGCDHDPNLSRMGWYCGNAREKTHSVAQKKANAWGLYDMHGNVWEWCQDCYCDYPMEAVTNPTGPSSGQYRVYRGGGWYDCARFTRSANRDRRCSDYRSFDVGFRVARDL